MFIPLLDGMDVAAKTITADALLTQRNLARYLVEERDAHYLFTVKDCSRSRTTSRLCWPTSACSSKPVPSRTFASR